MCTDGGGGSRAQGPVRVGVVPTAQPVPQKSPVRDELPLVAMRRYLGSFYKKTIILDLFRQD